MFHMQVYYTVVLLLYNGAVSGCLEKVLRKQSLQLISIHVSVHPNNILIQKPQQVALVTEFILLDDCCYTIRV